jgi:C-terminal processing protease CtpA/Prc
MVVLANQSSDPRLARGAQILSVDGRSTRSILRALMPYARADGGNDAKRRALLEVRGFDRYETFDVFYGLMFRLGAQVRLRVRPPGAARAETFDAPTIDLSTRRALLVTAPAENGAVWTLSYPRPEIALLTMPDWALYDSDWDWRGFLDQSFAEIAARGVTKLIVDIRGNEGGLDCGDLITARLSDAPIAREGYARRTRYRQTPERLNPYLDTWDRSFRNWGDDAVAREDGFYDLRDERGADQIAPLEPRFRGDVDVLIDSQNSSATFQFANCIKSNRLGRLIGAATGGNQRGINGGAFFFLRLPASGLEADLPLIARFPLTPKPDAGIAPDVEIELTREDIAAGRDAALEYAMG